MTPERDDIAYGLKMAGIAVMSAVITATAVIGAGEVWAGQTATEAAAAPDVPLHRIRADG